MRRAVLLLNAVMALGSAGSAVLGMVDPGILSVPGTEVSDGMDMYAQAYGVRAIPLAAGLLYLLARRADRGLTPILIVAGVAQLGDAVIGIEQGITGMAIGGTLGATVHLASAWWLSRPPARTFASGAINAG
ncbi:hypothetical protein OG948_13730 [Embleya sp. NBC_00888]|uniref:hypothetical protein n=1 Tax=Embleya sp. NBC_00888 TaxID=2975960 RepID=UPI003869E06D|nr:hypothetical protein OG948_13730 [Embleya sp. NBC_00888]